MKTKYILQTIQKYTEEKSYSHKPHLADLPHDRRTNDPELLQERLDAIDDALKDNKNKLDAEYEVQKECNDKIKELDDKNKEWENQIQQMKEASAQFEEYNMALKPKALEQVDKILEEFDKASEHTKLEHDPWADRETNYYLNDPRRLKELFKDGGLLTSYQANTLYGLSNSISIRTGDDRTYSQVKRDIESLAKMCDINNESNNDASEQLRKYYSFEGGPTYLQGMIDHNKKEIQSTQNTLKESQHESRHLETVQNDLKGEKDKTESKKKENQNR